MMPTADQVARVVVAAAHESGADPLEVMQAVGPKAVPVARARMYAAFALRKLFPDCPMPVIGRLVGESHPPYVSIIYSKIAKGQFAWFDMEALQRVMAAGAPTLPAAPETARTGRAATPEPVPTPEVPADPPEVANCIPDRPYQHSDFVVPPSKRALRDALRQAVERTAKMPSQNR